MREGCSRDERDQRARQAQHAQGAGIVGSLGTAASTALSLSSAPVTCAAAPDSPSPRALPAARSGDSADGPSCSESRSEDSGSCSFDFCFFIQLMVEICGCREGVPKF